MCEETAICMQKTMPTDKAGFTLAAWICPKSDLYHIYNSYNTSHHNAVTFQADSVNLALYSNCEEPDVVLDSDALALKPLQMIQNAGLHCTVLIILLLITLD